MNAEYLKSRTGCVLRTAYEKINKLLKSRGLKPKIHFLDNECAESFKTFITETQKDFQVVSPHIHRRNVSERTI